MEVRASGSGKEKSVARKPQNPRVRQHTSAHSAPRIPMAEQLTGLAPEGALGYRLVIPTRTLDDMPRLSPPLDATGHQGHYSLCPFQAPYDIRLMDGQTYRVVWIGASGEIISPKTDGTIPGLHFPNQQRGVGENTSRVLLMRFRFDWNGVGQDRTESFCPSNGSGCAARCDTGS